VASFKRTIAVDFDGVVHAYTTANRPFDPSYLPDPPVRGMIQWLAWMVRDPEFEVVIFSTRSTHEGGVEAMREYLVDNGLDQSIVDEIGFPTEKPPAWLTIDDRCWRFEGPGSLPSRQQILDFKPWNKP
jgi:hypothetical protein